MAFPLAGFVQGMQQGQDLSSQLELRKVQIKQQQQALKDQQSLIDAAPILLKMFQQQGPVPQGGQGGMPQGGGPGGAAAMPPGQSSQPATQAMPQQGPMPPGIMPQQAQGGPLRPPMPQAPAPQQQPQMGGGQAPQAPGGAQVPDPQVILQKVGQAVQRALPPNAPPELQKAVMDEYFNYLTKATQAAQPEVRLAVEQARVNGILEGAAIRGNTTMAKDAADNATRLALAKASMERTQATIGAAMDRLVYAQTQMTTRANTAGADKMAIAKQKAVLDGLKARLGALKTQYGTAMSNQPTGTDPASVPAVKKIQDDIDDVVAQIRSATGGQAAKAPAQSQGGQADPLGLR